MNKIGLFLAWAALAMMLPVHAFAGPVDVNTADAETLSAELKGVGLAKAQAIVAHRKQHGPFKSADELADVKGIGLRTVELNRENIRLEAPPKGKK